MNYNLNMKLQKLRDELGISQTAFGDKFGISQRMVSSYELGKAEPDIATIIKFADFFKVSTDTLLERDFNNIDFSKLSEVQSTLMSKIADMSNEDCLKLLGYIDGLKK